MEIETRGRGAFELEPYPAKDKSAFSGKLLEFLYNARQDVPDLVADLRAALGVDEDVTPRWEDVLAARRALGLPIPATQKEVKP